MPSSRPDLVFMHSGRSCSSWSQLTACANTPEALATCNICTESSQGCKVPARTCMSDVKKGMSGGPSRYSTQARLESWLHHRNACTEEVDVQYQETALRLQIQSQVEGNPSSHEQQSCNHIITQLSVMIDQLLKRCIFSQPIMQLMATHRRNQAMQLATMLIPFN